MGIAKDYIICLHEATTSVSSKLSLPKGPAAPKPIPLTSLSNAFTISTKTTAPNPPTAIDVDLTDEIPKFSLFSTPNVTPKTTPEEVKGTPLVHRT